MMLTLQTRRRPKLRNLAGWRQDFSISGMLYNLVDYSLLKLISYQGNEPDNLSRNTNSKHWAVEES